ncbi:MAG: ChuX/HutX family heme-like substrate-binding protein [Bacteroidota bacterium]
MEYINDLKQRLAQLKTEEPKLRSRDLAHRLGISEAELTSLDVEGKVIRLVGDWKSLLSGMKSMGYVMALTRNEACVHERKGVYDNLEFYGGGHNMGVAVNPDIDLRFFMNEWKYGLAVEMNRGRAGKLYSFQFFNGRGEAVHKIYSTRKSNIDAYHNLARLFSAQEQVPITNVDTSPVPKKEVTPDADIDVDGFQQAWKGLKDTHDFFGLLRKYKVGRTQGFRLAPKGFTEKVDNLAVVRMLKNVAAQKVPIMCFVHSKGCIQIHTGPVKNLKLYGDWYNVMDKAFNLHLNLEAVHESWIVQKPTNDGIVTSLELFDKEGNLIVYFFGARKPGKPELPEWRKVISNVNLMSKV